MTRCSQIVVVGASAGAVEVLTAVLPALPLGYPKAVLVVVHLPPARGSAIAELFRDRCRLEVKEADDKETIESGKIYFAPNDYHMLVEAGGYISLSADDPVNFSRPSIDVLFESAAEAFGVDALAVVLSGANQDGAAGARAIENAGGRVLVQRPDEAPSATMPQSAIDACTRPQVLCLAALAKILSKETAQ